MGYVPRYSASGSAMAGIMGHATGLRYHSFMLIIIYHSLKIELRQCPKYKVFPVAS